MDLNRAGLYQGKRRWGTEGPLCTRPRGMNSSAHSEEGQAQLCKNEGIGTVGGNEVWKAGRGQLAPSLVNFTKEPELYLVRNRKFIKTSSKGINVIMFGQRSGEIYKTMRSAIFLFKILFLTNLGISPTSWGEPSLSWSAFFCSLISHYLLTTVSATGMSSPGRSWTHYEVSGLCVWRDMLKVKQPGEACCLSFWGPFYPATCLK